MRCPRLKDLPPPLPGKRGWPWTEESPALYDIKSAYNDWPKITIVSPSFNQGRFIEETIRSILLQGYPEIEYIIIDGGSTDGSIDIIKKYEPWITYWCSEPDSGMYHALNKGFEKSSGEIMAWSNTDDLYLPSAFQHIGHNFQSLPQINWMTSLYKVSWNENSEEIKNLRIKGFCKKAFFQGYNLPGRSEVGQYVIQQQSTFWRREVWNKAGGYLKGDYQLAGDFELWARFFQHHDLYSLDVPLGIFRNHSDQKTSNFMERYLDEAEEAFLESGGRSLGGMELWIQKAIKRLPAFFLKIFSGFAYTARIIEYEESKGSWKIKKKIFL